MGRSSFVFGLGSIVNFVSLLFSKPVANQSREVFRKRQDRPPFWAFCAFFSRFGNQSHIEESLGVLETQWHVTRKKLYSA